LGEFGHQCVRQTVASGRVDGYHGYGSCKVYSGSDCLELCSQREEVVRYALVYEEGHSAVISHVVVALSSVHGVLRNCKSAGLSEFGLLEPYH
jgi:hypothetical protein